MGVDWDNFCELERLRVRVKTLWDSRQKWKKRALKAEALLKAKEPPTPKIPKALMTRETLTARQSEALARYRELYAKIDAVRAKYNGLESDEERDMMEEMDSLWWNLSVKDREIVNKDPRLR